ncbi:MAG: polysulfide reductase NrfD [candidate division Zixibacteria bacterium]|nr:polysulfide reductase NrfD [candidate division Zixibacteria bacterium]
MDRARVFKSILWTISGLGAAALATRFLIGLGSIANMNDAVPWGIWKGFNIFPGIALAGGGFVMTAIIYIMGREEYHKYAKVSVLLAFLGYITAATALVTELGLPWFVWHPIIYWQHHSPLFEVSWCVMLYLTVLFLEFVPVPLEETSRFTKVRKFLTKYKIVLVFLGIMISTLHQSSLGSMWLITPEKLHPLWYTQLLPILFLLSAIAIGPIMLILAILVISRIYRRKTDNQTLARLGVLSSFMVLTYGLVRLIDIGANGKFAMIFDGSWQSAIFIVEMSLMVIIPLILMGIRKLRNSSSSLWVASLSAVIGLGLDRANIAGVMLSVDGPRYTPTIFEVLVSLSIISAAILVFLFCIERFKIWDSKWEDPREDKKSRPDFDRSSEVWLGTPRLAGRTVYTLIFVISLAVGFAIIPGKRIYSGGIQKVASQKSLGGDTLFIDGNRDNYGVNFDHKAHVIRDSSCVLCHHMNQPNDKQSGCYTCHLDMYQRTDAFKHDWHANPTGANISCTECHAVDQERLASTAKACDQCHKDLIPPGATITVDKYMAPSYTDAMHFLCVDCHKQKAVELADKSNLALCATCHTSEHTDHFVDGVTDKYKHPYFNHVVLPENRPTVEGH